MKFVVRYTYEKEGFFEIGTVDGYTRTMSSVIEVFSVDEGDCLFREAVLKYIPSRTNLMELWDLEKGAMTLGGKFTADQLDTIGWAVRRIFLAAIAVEADPRARGLEMEVSVTSP